MHDRCGHAVNADLNGLCLHGAGVQSVLFNEDVILVALTRHIGLEAVYGVAALGSADILLQDCLEVWVTCCLLLPHLLLFDQVWMTYQIES